MTKKNHGGKTRKYPRCQVCGTLVWHTTAKFCKKHSGQVSHIKRSTKHRDEAEIIMIVKNGMVY